MKIKKTTWFAVLALLGTAILMLVEVRACEESPGKPTISVSGAQAGSDQNYYVVEIPAQGTTTVTLTAGGQTPCPTDSEKCTCQYNSDKVTPDTDGDPKFTFTMPLGNQDPADGPTVKIDVTQSTTPGEYKFKVTKIEQKYKACSQGWSGGVTSKSNTQSSDEVTVLIYKIETETVATTPTDRRRTKLGVGEEVNITVMPSSASVTWAVDNNTPGGTVSPGSGTAVVYTAGNEAAQTKVYATIKGVQKTLSFNVIAPNSAFLDLYEAHNTQTNAQLQVAAYLNVYVGPEDVNFSRQVYIAEQSCNGTGSGYFQSANGRQHIPQAALKVSGNLTSGKGWKLSGYDSVSSFNCYPQYSTGSFNWSIPYNYEIGVGSIMFTTVNHGWQMSIVANKGVLSMQKSNYSDSVTQP